MNAALHDDFRAPGEPETCCHLYRDCNEPAAYRMWHIACREDCMGHLVCVRHAAQEREWFHNTELRSDLQPQTRPSLRATT